MIIGKLGNWYKTFSFLLILILYINQYFQSGMVLYTCNLRRQRQRNAEFEANLHFTTSAQRDKE
jgi:hypothetical protein